ncbi:MAG: sigma-70 family RNA polymerase sigma factor [Bacteroidetes bacterium]|nr:sigma-70 family RNA polymerase sigma factor [Bacteroidota bacterium]
MPKDIDKEIIEQCLKREERGYNRLYREMFSFLINICMRYKNNYDEAGAATNEIFLKIVNGLSDFDINRPIYPWAKTIAIRFLIDEFRTNKPHRENQIDAGETLVNAVGSESRTDENLGVKDLIKMIRQLPETMAEVFNLFAIDGYQHKEIAEMLGISEGTSRWYLSKAREILKQRIYHEEKTTTVTK